MLFIRLEESFRIIQHSARHASANAMVTPNSAGRKMVRFFLRGAAFLPRGAGFSA